MSWLAAYRRDIQRYVAYSERRSRRKIVLLLLTEQGLWALFQYRVSRAVYQSALPWPLKKPLLILALFWRKLVEVVTGISLPYRASIGPGLYIGHYGPILVHPHATIGESCNISQGVTIGVGGRWASRGAPAIGDRVYIGANAVIAGKLAVGDDAVVAANSLVGESVPAHTTALGVPAVVVSKTGSQEYISPGVGA